MQSEDAFNLQDSQSSSSEDENESFEIEVPEEQQQPPSPPQIENQYNRKNWIKIQYEGKIKRISNPPTELKDLIKLIRARFVSLDTQLKEYLRQFEDLGIYKDEEEDLYLLKYISITYIDQDGDEILIDETDRLIDAYKFQESNPKRQVLKFIIDLEPPRLTLIQKKSIKIQNQLVEERKSNMFEFEEEEKYGQPQPKPTLINSMLQPQFMPQPDSFQQPQANAKVGKASLFDLNEEEDYQYQPRQTTNLNYSEYVPQAIKEESKENKLTMADLMEDKDDGDNPLNGMSQQEIDQIMRTLQHRMSFRPQELQNQQLIYEQIKNSKLSQNELQSVIKSLQSHQSVMPDEISLQDMLLRQNEVRRETQHQAMSDEMLARKLQEEENMQSMNRSDRLNSQQRQIIHTRIPLDGSCRIVNYDNIEQKKDIGKKITGTFSKWAKETKNFFDDKKVNKNRQLMAVAEHGTVSYVKAARGAKQIQFAWVIVNKSEVKWEKTNNLRNYMNEEVAMAPIITNKSVKPGKKVMIKVDILFKGDTSYKEKLVFQFRFESQKKEPFGDFFIGIIDFQAGPVGYRDSVLSPNNPHYSFVNQQPNENRSQTVSNNPNQVDDQHLAKAMVCADMGLGEQELCLQMIQACKGNEMEAQRMLNLLMQNAHS